MGNCRSGHAEKECARVKTQGSVQASHSVNGRPPFRKRSSIRDSLVSSNADGFSVQLRVADNSTLDLEDALEMARVLLETRQDENSLSSDEIKAALRLYKELQRVLSVATRTGNLMQRKTDFKHDTPFNERYQKLVKEFDDAQNDCNKALATPAAVRPLSIDALQEVNDFFILDNSLRETTVGAAKGHTMEEKLKIIESITETGLEEVILGSFGAKVSVDTQVAAKWKNLGKSFDCAWGFSDAFDMHALDAQAEEALWNSVPDLLEAEARGEKTNFYVPPADPRTKYTKKDLHLLRKASKGFRPNAFGGASLQKVLLKSQSKNGRVPLGLLMMAGYGICNAIIEIDTSVESFDYEKYDIVERCKFLIRWCKENLPRREKVPPGQDNTARVLLNLRDFSNYNRSSGGMEQALRLVDALSSVPPEDRPFGFIYEEPTGLLWPDEVGRLCRMIRLTMNRAGFPQGRLLIHVHWYFGLAEATQLTALCNGADGVWAAVCKVGAQVGHACSTMTAVNLLRAGHNGIPAEYNLAKMCKAAREVTEISTRHPCGTHEEIYGEQAFDVPFFMVNVPACRYALAQLLKELDIDVRRVRLNEIIVPSAVAQAMTSHFGPPKESGWNPDHCKKMFDAIHNHLMTGLSRDYNTPLGLGHLYGLVSQEMIPTEMVRIMMQESPISDYHPTVLEFIDRWNRLCAHYEGEELPPHPAVRSKSIMMWGTDVNVKPRRISLPFEFFLADVMRNPVLEPVPRLFKLQVLSLVTKNERELQHKKVPEINFFEAVLRLKLFIMEAESLGVMGLVDDFCIRKNHDYFFGEDHLWLQQVRGNKPRVVNKMLRSHIDWFPKFYMNQGNNAMVRCVRAAAKRIEENKCIDSDIQQTFESEDAQMALEKVIAMEDEIEKTENTGIFSVSHEKMLKDMAEDEGQDEEAAAAYMDRNMDLLGISGEVVSNLADAYTEESKSVVNGMPKRSDNRHSARKLIQDGLRAQEERMINMEEQEQEEEMREQHLHSEDIDEE